MKKIDIWRWLRSEEKNYFEGVEILGKACPKHPLLANLQEDVSFMNRRYLEAAMQKVYEGFSIKKKEVAVASEPSQPVRELKEDDKHRILEKELAKLYAERRRLSNTFHNCNSNAERAIVSDNIKSLIIDINTQKSRIGVYKATGVVPPLPGGGKLEIPQDNGKLQRLILNFRSKVSAQRKLINEYDQQERRKPKAKHEYHLSELETTLRKLENERKKREQSTDR